MWATYVEPSEVGKKEKWSTRKSGIDRYINVINKSRKSSPPKKGINAKKYITVGSTIDADGYALKGNRFASLNEKKPITDPKQSRQY